MQWDVSVPVRLPNRRGVDMILPVHSQSFATWDIDQDLFKPVDKSPWREVGVVVASQRE